MSTKTTEGVYYLPNGAEDEDGTVTTEPTEALAVVVTISLTGNAESINGVDASKAMDNTFTVTFTARSIQAHGFANAQAAYDALTA